MRQVWFITGSSRGFGRALVQAILDAGDLVIATARRPGQLAEFTQQYGDRVLPLALDVTDEAAVRDAVSAAVERFGRLDVVNNAGYANVAPIETGDEEDFRTQFETNFWGFNNGLSRRCSVPSEACPTSASYVLATSRATLRPARFGKRNRSRRGSPNST
jgi:NAD(P)-dependent dehydrogenase (short-subunit alcohol dehydrogenase family)